MKNFASVMLTILVFALPLTAQDAPRPLVLTGAIPLPGVHGRIDHLAIDGKGHLFLSALGSNSEQVLDIGGQNVVHVISDIPTPQGVVYSPETNKLFVGSAKGNLYIYDGSSYKLITTIDFHGDVDNLRYDPSSETVFVGFGDGETAAIGTVDATNNRRGRDFKLGAHPESFQLERDGTNIYVNLPDLKQIAVVNRKTWTVTRWPLADEGNFPMALDEADHRVFVNTRAPGKLLVVDTTTGKTVASLPSVEDCDDLYYDSARKRIYASGGEGFIAVFQQKDTDQYQLLARIPTALGARTSGYFGKLGKKAFDRSFLAVPSRADRGAEVWIYTLQD
jgi:DNA-binding beta-propeller fold protein YncE